MTGKTWYLHPAVCLIIVVACAVIDGLGFRTAATAITTPTMAGETALESILPIAGLAAAFEVAPLYMGYALCLKLHGMGKQIWKYVLGFSMAAFLLGVAVNYCFRFLAFVGQFLPDIVETMKKVDISEITRSMTAGEFLMKAVRKLVKIYADMADKQKLTITLGGTIAYSQVPVITSLINLTIGCLAFDPLYADVAQLSKKLARLQAQKCWLEAKKKEKEQGSCDYLEACKAVRWATEKTRFEMQQAYVHIVVDGIVQKEIESHGKSFWWKIFKG